MVALLLFHPSGRPVGAGSRLRPAAWLLISLFACHAAVADETPPPAAGTSAADTPAEFAVHGQLTYVEQETHSFRAPYSGRNSLSPDKGAETVDITLFVGARLGRDAELWITPEGDEGFGLDDTLGVAGFPSGEAYKVGANQPYFRLPRAFIRDTLSLGGAEETVGAAPNQMAAVHSADRWVFTLGKFAVTDIFDINRYAHDPRVDFFNWAAVDAGSFDYAADAWGYTVGAAAEWYEGPWAIRAGVFDLSNIPNSIHLDPGAHEFQIDAEAERRYALFGAPGKSLITWFHSRGRMALLDDAVDLAESTGEPIDLAAVRRYRTRDGVSFSSELELTSDFGLFARGGKAGGNVETYEFTDIDRTLALGLSLAGSRWARADDTFGLAGMINGISATRERYLNAGGLGILVGDGQLPHPGVEKILETYYSVGIAPGVHVSLDYQRVTNPGYNRDRGPVPILAV
ncbi:MAG TPA: carbohydrate porin, partial [Steroidobacteraceae bacterium]|nr:carbohydrate porin [Steroidobacteraceae bacterium]